MTFPLLGPALLRDVASLLQSPRAEPEPATAATTPDTIATPAAAPPPAATPQAQRVDDALAARARAQQQVDDNDQLIRQGNRAALAERPALQENLAAADREVVAAVDAEARAGFESGPMASRPTGAVYDATAIGEQGRAIAARHAGDPAAQALVNDAIAGLQAQSERDALVPNMLAAGDDPQAALDGLASDLARLDPAQRDAVLADPRIQGLIHRAAAWAGEPLAGREGDALAYAIGAGNASARRLADLADGLPPELALRLAEEARPLLDRIGQARQHRAADDPGGSPGTDRAFTINDRIASLSRLVDALGDPNDPRARALIGGIAADYVSLGDSNAAGPVARDAVAAGNSPTLVLEIAQQLHAAGDTRGAQQLVIGATDGVSAQHADATGALDAYNAHVEEYAFLMGNAQGLPPEQLKQASDAYLAAKGPGWQQRADQLMGGFTAAGTDVSVSLAQLHALPPELRPGYTDQFLARVGDDPNTLRFVDYATASDPSLLRGEAGERLVGYVIDGVKVGKEGTEAGRRIASRYVSEQGLDILADVRPGDPASIQQAISRMHALGDSRLCGLLGVSPVEYRRAVLSLERVLTYPVDMRASFDLNMRGIANVIGENQVFQEGTLQGNLFRSLNVGAALVLTGKAGADFASDPGVANAFSLAGDGFGLGKDAYDAISSFMGKPANGFALRTLGALSAIGDAYNAFTFTTGAFGVEQNPDKAVIHGLGAAGTLLMTFTGGLGGAVAGATLVLLSVLGKQEYDADQAAHRFETPASRAFLEGLGLDRDAAAALSLQSAQGHGALPLLAQYATHKGYDLSDPQDLQAFAGWLNDAPPEQLRSLVGLLGAGMDAFEGDAGRLGKDATVIDPAHANGDQPDISAPRTVGQIDGLIQRIHYDPTMAGISPLSARN